MSRRKISGFTLIELMVVIVIIGVLASLAIPRFTEASGKAKVAEAPRVLASFESGLLAAQAELSENDLTAIEMKDLVFEVPKDSRWWTYDDTWSGEEEPFEAKANSDMGKFKKDGTLTTAYVKDDKCFDHQSDDMDVAGKMVPNFTKGGCAGVAP
jgi:prepilin-type N-terminal cleavage/methylation domain-containing protein